MAEDGLVESLERAQVERLTYLENLQHKVNEWQHDREGLLHLCTEVDQMEGRKINFRKLLTELDGHRAALESTAAKETELFTPQQYEATFERRLFRNTLGLDIRLTQDRLISLVFSHVDHEQSDRQFRVTLDVSDTGQWEVVNLDPHVHGIDGLLCQLNSPGGSITSFCKAFRQQCKHYMTSSSST